MFFAETQNKLLYAVTHHTAAEIIIERADAQKQNMGLMSWKGNVVRKQDVIVAKNYLFDDELDKLNRLVTIFLESAELRVMERRDLTIDFWRKNVDSMLSFNGQDVLVGKGTISNIKMEKIVAQVYDDFDKRRKSFEADEADKQDLLELEAIEEEIRSR